MRILFDQGVPAPLRRDLPNHVVTTAFEMGWSLLSNGELLRAAESQFDLLITTDKNLRHQQKITGYHLAVLVLPTTSWPVIRSHTTEIIAAVNSVQSGTIGEVIFAN